MFIVKHIPSGRYFRGRQRNYLQSEVFTDDKNKARVFRSKSGITNCLGTQIKNAERTIDWSKRPFYHMKLDEAVWEVIPITLEVK